MPAAWWAEDVVGIQTRLFCGRAGKGERGSLHFRGEGRGCQISQLPASVDMSLLQRRHTIPFKALPLILSQNDSRTPHSLRGALRIQHRPHSPHCALFTHPAAPHARRGRVRNCRPRHNCLPPSSLLDAFQATRCSSWQVGSLLDAQISPGSSTLSQPLNTLLVVQRHPWPIVIRRPPGH